MEKLKQSTKETVFNVIIKVLVFIAFCWPAWYATQAFYNMLPYMAEGIAMLDMLSASSQKVMFTVVMPLLSALIVFGLFMLLEKVAMTSLVRNMQAFGKTIDIKWHQATMEIIAIAIALFKGMLATIFAFYPLSANVLRPILNTIVKLVFIALLYFLYWKKDGKEMFPFVFSSLMLPTILVVLFV